MEKTKTETTFNEMREKEIINLFDGKRLGRVIDIVFNCQDSTVLGIVVPPIKKLFARKSDDIFIPLSLIEKIGDDCILVKLGPKTQTHEEVKKENKLGVYSEYSRELSAK